MKRFYFILLLLVATVASAQVSDLNLNIKNNTLTADRVYSALKVMEVLTVSGTDTYSSTVTGATGLYSGSKTYQNGDRFIAIFANANTTTTPTWNINGEGAVTIVDNKGDPVAAGDVEGLLQLMHDGTNFRIVGGTGSGGGGGGTVTDVLGTTNRITSSGGATPTIDISATFEALLGKVAQRIDQNNAATTSAQLATTLSDETGTGTVVYSASPALTGTPTSPTAATTTNTTQLATTAFVQQEIDARSETFVIPFTDEITPITATTSKRTFHWPYASTTITGIWVGLTTAQTSGSIFTVDVNEAGTTILSTKITVDNTEQHSSTAATPPVISDASIAQWSLITVDVDQQGDNTAKGGKLYIQFTRP